MSFRKKTIRDVDLDDKSIVYRVDYNVPLDESGRVEDDFRIQMTIPTIEYLLNKKCQITLLSHAGRPEPGKPTPDTSLRDCARVLSEKLSLDVGFVDDALGERPEDAQIVLMENLRYYAEEKANDTDFAKQLASLGEIYVNDAFAVDHRAHASTAGIAEFLPAVAGFLLEKEVTNIQSAMEDAERPILAILSGVKMETKVPLIEKFINYADNLVIGGGVANTLLANEHFGGHNVGKSVYDDDQDEAIARIATQLESAGKKLTLPDIDLAVGKSTDDSQRREVSVSEVQDDDLILDFGEKSLATVVGLVRSAKTIIWNGPLGFTENPQFAKASEIVAREVADASAYTLIGGGDTGGFVESLGLHDKFDHISTGGGAALELMAGTKLPGIEALEDK